MKLNPVIIFLVIFSCMLFSQERKYFDTPFGGGGGYTPGWYFPNLDIINQELNALGIPNLSESGFYSSGGAGFIYIGFVDYLGLEEWASAVQLQKLLRRMQTVLQKK
jgi:hypothetical protein